MSENIQEVSEQIKKCFTESAYEVVDLVPVQAEASQELLVNEYWVRVRVRTEDSAPKPCLDGIYLPNGKLNISYLIKNADLLYEAGEFALARKIYKSIYQSGEYSSTALYRLGKCYEAEGRLEDACTKYEESIAHHPTLECFQRLASLLTRLKKDKKAAEMMERAMVLKEFVALDSTSRGLKTQLDSQTRQNKLTSSK